MKCKKLKQQLKNKGKSYLMCLCMIFKISVLKRKIKGIVN